MQYDKLYLVSKSSFSIDFVRNKVVSIFSSRKTDWLIVMLLPSCLMVTMCAAVYLFYAYPMADDYYYAASAHAKNPIAATIERYFTWSGRWGSHLTEYSVLHFFGLFKYYHVFLWVSFIIFILSMYAFFRALLNRIFLRREAFILCLVFFSVFWSGSPALGEQLYWFVGCVEKLAPLSFALLLASATMRAKNISPPNNVLIKMIPMMGFSIFAASYHEISSVVVSFTIICIYLFMCPKKIKLNFAQHTLLVTYILGTLIVLIAPGNFLRREYEAQGSIRLLDTIYLTARQIYRYVPGWLLDIRVVSSGMLFMLVLWEKLSSNTQAGLVSPSWKKLSMALWPLSLLVGFFLPTAALQHQFPGRVLSQLYFLFILGLYLNIYIAVSTWNYFKIAPIPLLYSRFLKLIFGAIFSLSIILTGNSKVAYYDFREGLLPKYISEMSEFDQSIKNEVNRGGKHFIFTDIKNLPCMYYKAFPKNDENYYVNIHLAKYYGLESVRSDIN